MQAKLLRALQERAVVPVGGREPVPFRARLVCATNADLGADVAAGRFRVDLYHRVAEFLLPLPPLRERPDDVLHFAQRFLAEANTELGRCVGGITPAAAQALRQHRWPGNLRELRNVIRRAVLTAAGSELDASDLDLHAELPTGGGDPSDPATKGMPLAERVRAASDRLEATILKETLDACVGNKAAAARQLHIDYTTMHRKLKRHGIPG